jgi:Mlc titration factor MtfA (ptsG expression regulator)
MTTLLWLTAAGATAAALIIVLNRHRQRARALATPLAPAQRTALARLSPLYARLPDTLRRELEPAMRAFLGRVAFVGCNGLTVSDEMRLLVAMHAALLTRRIGIGAFDRLYSVLLYPDEFVVEQRIEDEETGLVTEGSEVLSGQTIETDRVIFSWRDVLEGASSGQPYNVIAHELAHYLDHVHGGALSDPRGTATWHATLAREQAVLRDAIDRGEETLIDPYGTEDSAEFFCVATEAFLETPEEFATRHPVLYAELSRFYGIDPASWPARAPA